MPSTVYMEVDPRRDHSFRLPRPDLTVEFDVPNACNQCHTDRTADWAAEQIRLRYAEQRADHFAPLFDAASRGLSSAEAGLARLVADTTLPVMIRATAAARLAPYNRGYTLEALQVGLADPDALVRYGSLRGLAGLTEDTRWRLGNALLFDDRLAIRHQAFRTLLRSASNPRRRDILRSLLADYLEVLAFNGDRPEAHTSAASAHAALGNFADAESAFKAAIAIEPDWVPAMVNLADLYRANGRDVQGHDLLERAVASSPEDAGVHYALALWLVRNDETDQALARFAQAHELALDQPGYTYALALALNGSGQTIQALELLEEAHSQWPQNTDFLFALATMIRDLGRFTEAVKYVEKLRQIAPGNANYQNLEDALNQQLGNLRER
ncbi:MAG: tetratricopeptide repeat protein, partial [Gammaproteobacteria bacterium]|nr:tetratricopeptide repeat protein [Gammaproteobacteria bacterium]